MATPKEGTKQMHSPDESILGDIWRALWDEETIRTIDIHDISVGVEKGQVCLSGHLSKDTNQQQIVEIVRSTPGVIAVHNHLVTDHDLIIRVAQALGDNERTRLFILPVYSYHGWIELGGSVPNRDLQRLVESTAASIPAVRGVTMLPNIAGEQNDSVRNVIQPHIGVRVFGEGESQGTVYQVVIAPQNRLVTHAIVRATHIIDSHLETCDYLVPVEAMNVVDEGGIFLNDNAPAINQLPIFNPAQYPFPPLTWQPPYPYAVGNVRWPAGWSRSLA